jgi:hypothetical protein
MNKELGQVIKDNLSKMPIMNESDRQFNLGYKAGFREGAEWQKEQEKELLNQAYQLLCAYDIRYPHTTQLLVGHLNEDIMNRLHARVYPEMNDYKTEAQNNKTSD